MKTPSLSTLALGGGLACALAACSDTTLPPTIPDGGGQVDAAFPSERDPQDAEPPPEPPDVEAPDGAPPDAGVGGIEMGAHPDWDLERD